MIVALVIFWSMVGLLALTYVGYPLLLALAVLVRGKPKPQDPEQWPRISALVVAYNEGERIAEKITNILECDYPSDRIEVIVCSDGSTDDTNRIVEAYDDPRVHLAASPTNVGVNEAFAVGAKVATGDVFLMTDSGAVFQNDAIRKAARHFADPKVGIVSGRIIFENPNKTAIGGGYRSYWVIETTVRRLESHLGLGVVIVGAFEMIRREAYLPVPSEYANDITAPMYTHLLGYRCRYEPEALQFTPQNKTAGQDFGRRTRMSVRAWSNLPYLARVVPPWKDPIPWAAMLIHKFFRYITWAFLVPLLVANAFLLDEHFLYRVTFWAQVAGYAMALVGMVPALLKKSLPPFSMAFYFCLLQGAAMVGFFKALFGHRIRTWKPVD